MRIITCLLFVLVVFSPSFSVAGEVKTAKKLTEAEADKVLDGIFKRAREITHLRAELITTKTGGSLKRPETAYETVSIQAPDRILLINRGTSKKAKPFKECHVMLMDGKWLWEIQPPFEGEDTREASRRSFKNSAKSGRGLDIGAFLIGRAVKTPSELRDDFAIDTVLEENKGRKSYHFTLKPRRESGKLEMWIEPGKALPWKVIITEHKEVRFPAPPPGKKPKIRISHTERVLESARTNRDGLPPFPLKTFVFPLADAMEVIDEKTGKELQHAAIKKELQALLIEWQQHSEKGKKNGKQNN